MYNNILDIKGLKVGQIEDRKGLTGCTVVICIVGINSQILLLYLLLYQL